MTRVINQKTPEQKAAKAAKAAYKAERKAANKQAKKERGERRMWLVENHHRRKLKGDHKTVVSLCNSTYLPVILGGVKYPCGKMALLCETDRRLKLLLQLDNCETETTETPAAAAPKTKIPMPSLFKTARAVAMRDEIEEQVQRDICQYKYETYDIVKQALLLAKGKELVFWPDHPQMCHKFDIQPSSRWEAVVLQQKSPAGVKCTKRFAFDQDVDEIVGENMLAKTWKSMYLS